MVPTVGPWNPTQGDGVRSPGGVWEVTGYEGGAAVRVFIKDSAGSSLVPPTMGGHSEKTASESQEEPSADADYAPARILDVQPPGA